MAVEFRFGYVPGRLGDAVVEEGTTVRAALEALEVTLRENEIVSVNGQQVNLDSPITPETRTVVISRVVKGN